MRARIDIKEDLRSKLILDALALYEPDGKIDPISGVLTFIKPLQGPRPETRILIKDLVLSGNIDEALKLCRDVRKALREGAMRFLLNEISRGFKEAEASWLKFDSKALEIKRLMASGNIKKAIKKAKKIKDRPYRDMGFFLIIKTLADQGLISEALEVFKTITWSFGSKGRALAYIAESLARMGNFDVALEIIGKIDHGYWMSKALADVAVILASHGMIDKALKLVQAIKGTVSEITQTDFDRTGVVTQVTKYSYDLTWRVIALFGIAEHVSVHPRVIGTLEIWTDSDICHINAPLEIHMRLAALDDLDEVIVDFSEASEYLSFSGRLCSSQGEVKLPKLRAGLELSTSIRATPKFEFTGKIEFPVRIRCGYFGAVINMEIEGVKTALPPKQAARDITDYEMLVCIGGGSLSRVYKAREKASDRIVAIKVPANTEALMEADESSGGAILKIFREEASIWLDLTNQNVKGIVKLLAFGTEPYPWLVMEYMPNGSLRDRVGRLSWREAVRLVMSLAGILHEIHLLGIRHFDIKPENILFDENNQPCLSDFGTAKVQLELNKALEKRTGLPFFGTVEYAAPEQISDRFGRPDHRTDIYQLGAVLYELLTGRPPFVGKNPLDVALRIGYEKPIPPHELNPEVPECVSRVVLKALAKRPEGRYKDMLEFKKALEECLD